MLAEQTQSVEGFIKIVFALFVLYCCIIRKLLQISILDQKLGAENNWKVFGETM